MTAKRVNISSGSKFEEAYGYSRAVRVGETLYLSGTTGYDYATMSIPEDPGEQARNTLRNIESALAKAGASPRDIVQCTTYVSDASYWEAVGKVLGEWGGEIRPTQCALVVQFPFPAIKVEIMVVAVIGCGG